MKRLLMGGNGWKSAFVISAVVIGTIVGRSAVFADDASKDGTLTKVGEAVPDFALHTLDGRQVSPKSTHGQLLVLDFFATWCGPCMAEMPELQKEVVDRFKDRRVNVLAVGREHSEAELREFQKSHPNLTMALAADPHREVYTKFATEFIPRIYLIGPDGKILDQVIGYSPGGMDTLAQKIDKALSALPPTTQPQ